MVTTTQTISSQNGSAIEIRSRQSDQTCGSYFDLCCGTPRSMKHTVMQTQALTNAAAHWVAQIPTHVTTASLVPAWMQWPVSRSGFLPKVAHRTNSACRPTGQQPTADMQWKKDSLHRTSHIVAEFASGCGTRPASKKAALTQTNNCQPNRPPRNPGTLPAASRTYASTLARYRQRERRRHGSGAPRNEERPTNTSCPCMRRNKFGTF